MIEEMQSRGLVINNLPPVLLDPAQPSTSSVPQSSGKGAEGAPVKPPIEPSSDESSEDYYQRYSAFPESKCGYDFTSIYSRFDHLRFFFFVMYFYFSTEGPMWTTEVRVEMAKKGLYMKHSIDHPLLAGFNNYLHTDLGNKNSKQEVNEMSEGINEKKKCVCVALVLCSAVYFYVKCVISGGSSVQVHVLHGPHGAKPDVCPAGGESARVL